MKPRLPHLTGRLWTATALAVLISATATAQSIESSDDTTPASRPADVRSDGELESLDDLGDIDLLDLDVPVVVTASRREQSIDDVPYAITVITADDIRRSGARTVCDALRLAPGVDVADLNTWNSAVSPRGFHGFLSNQTLVLVDGRQIFDSFFGGTVWGAWPFQLEDIARIEVIRGPGGVTWGANAMNGVINIITKDPKDQEGVAITSAGGSHGYLRQHLGYAYADQKLRFRISGEYEASDGFRRGGTAILNLNDEYKGGRMGLHGVYEAGDDDTITFSLGSAIVDGGFARSPVGGLRGAHPENQTNFVLGKWTHHGVDTHVFEVTGYVNDYHVIAALPQVDYRYQQYALQLSHTFEPADNHTLTWGLDSRVDVVDAGNADPFMLESEVVSTGIIGAYVQDEWRFAERWTLNLGGRVDYDTYGGFQPSGRAALSYRLNNQTSFYGAISRAFHMAPGALRDMDTPFLQGLARARTNRKIAPQTLVAYEVGYAGRYLDHRLHLNANAFWHEYWDLTTLSPRIGPPAIIRMDEDNRAAASQYGVELDAQFSVTNKLTLLGNYTYQQFDWESRAPISDKEIISPPQHKFMVGARCSATDDLHFSSHLYWVDKVEAPNPWNPFKAGHVDSYFRLDLMAEHEFWEDRAAFSVGVRNLIDTHHYEGGTLFLNDAEVPRMIYAQLRLSFK